MNDLDEHVLVPVSMRDFFAACAMIAHCHGLRDAALGPKEWHEEVAMLAYRTADAMLLERQKELTP